MNIFRDRLIANDFIQIRKVIEHVYEKVLGVLDTNAYGTLGGVNGGVGASTPAGSVVTPTGPSPVANSLSASATSPTGEKGLPGSTTSSATADRQETNSIAEDKVELLCNDQVWKQLFFNYFFHEMRGVRQQSCELVLHSRSLKLEWILELFGISSGNRRQILCFITGR